MSTAASRPDSLATTPGSALRAGHAIMLTLTSFGAGLLVGIGLACLAIAPVAQTCVTDFDHQVCETTGTVVSNLVRLAVVSYARVPG